MKARLKITAVSFAGCLAVSMAGAAFAKSTDVLVLGDGGTSSMATLGAIAPSKPKSLQLGELRTGEAQLPGGLTSKADRMRLRAERAEARRQALDEAKR